MWAKWMHSDAKNHAVAVIGEFVGATLFLFFAFAGTQTANINSKAERNVASGSADIAALLYISMSFGLSLMVNAWVFFRISGELFNPAVNFHPIRAILLVISLVSGACFAAYLVGVMFPSPKNFGTALGQVFTIIMLAKEKHRATFISPVGIELSVFISELVAVYYTGDSLNPARSFGPAAVAHDFLDTQWIYWVSPYLGLVFAVGFYRLIMVLEYEMANPG
ncbi:aquaporin-like protein [Acephala macrosclerotiorum]|nr:aquaporin-like protein [Acephala macrosclerotiorum]